MKEMPISEIKPKPTRHRSTKSYKIFTPTRARMHTRKLRKIYESIIKLESEYASCYKSACPGNDNYMASLKSVRGLLAPIILEGVRHGDSRSPPYGKEHTAPLPSGRLFVVESAHEPMEPKKRDTSYISLSLRANK